MKTIDWFGSLKKQSVLSDIIPLELLPGMPLPVNYKEIFLLYIPFYYMQLKEGKLFCSNKLCETYFDFVSKKLILYKDLRFLSQKKLQLDFSCNIPSDAKIRRTSLAAEQLFQELDDMKEIYLTSQSISSKMILEYKNTLFETLLIPQQSIMYEELSI